MGDSVRGVVAVGVAVMVEAGPGKALTGFVRKTVPEMAVYTIETVADVENLVKLTKEDA